MDDCSVETLDLPGSPGKVVLKVVGRMTIADAGGLAGCIRTAMDGHDELVLDVRGVTEVDLAGLQIVCAAHLSSAESGRTLTVRGGADGPLATAASAAGLASHGQDPAHGSGCFYFGGGE